MHYSTVNEKAKGTMLLSGRLVKYILATPWTSLVWLPARPCD